MADTKSTAQIEIEAKLGGAIKSFGALIDSMEKIQEGAAGSAKELSLFGKISKRIRSQLDALADRFPKIAKGVRGLNTLIKKTRKLILLPIEGMKRLGKAAKSAGEAIQSINAAVQLINTGMGWLRSAASSAFGVIAEGVRDIAEVNPFDPMILRLKFLEGTLRDMRSNAVRPLVEGFTNAARQLEPLISAFSSFLGSDLKSKTSAFEQFFVDVGNIILKLIVPALRIVLSLLHKGAELFNEWRAGEINEELTNTRAELEGITTTTEALVNTFKKVKYKGLTTEGDQARIADLTEKIEGLDKKRLGLLIDTSTFSDVEALLDTLEERLAGTKLEVGGADALREVPNLVKEVRRAILDGVVGIEEWGETWFESVGIADSELGSLLDKLKEMPRGLEGAEGLDAFEGWLKGLGIAEEKFIQVLELVESSPEKLKTISPVDVAKQVFDFASMRSEWESYNKALEKTATLMTSFTGDASTSIVELSEVRDALQPVVEMFPRVGTAWEQMLEAFKRQPRITLQQQVESVDEFVSKLESLKMISSTNLGAAEASYAAFVEVIDRFDLKLADSTATQKKELDKRLQAWRSFAMGMGSAISSGMQGSRDCVEHSRRARRGCRD